MPNVIYTVRPDGLLREADSIERSAKESQKSWLILGQYDKYGDTMRKADLLRRAAAEKSVYTRREILRNAGYTVKTPKALNKNPKTRNNEGVTMATKKFSPAQIAAQKLFAERARAGTLGKTVKRKTNPVEGKSIFNLGGGYFGSVSMSGYNEYYAQVFYRTTDSTGSTDDQIVPDYKPRYFVSAKSAVSSLMRYKTKNLGRKPNPENVLQMYTVFHRGTSNVAGTVRETSPKAAKEKIANRLGLPTLAYLVARKGERLQNPDKAKPRAYVKRASQATGAPPSKRLVTRRKKALTAPAGYFPNPKVKYTNRAKDMKGDQRVGYSVHMADRPSYQAIAWFSKKDDAVKVAQEASDRTGKQLAVTRVQNYFGAM